MKISIPSVLLLAFAWNSIFAQTYLDGVVVEEDAKGNLNPIIGANVYWLGSTIGTTTDTLGYFSILDDHQIHQLVISYVGYQTDTLSIAKHDKLTIILKNVMNLEEVEVVYREKSTKIDFRAPLNTQIMGEKELFKAACCNLSESFETNPSIDVSFTDAVTGTRQIEMLGLAGIYTQITQENMPYIRGIASNIGLSYTPGTWIESIQVTKGVGPVINGYESMAGQINVELEKPEHSEEEEKGLTLNTYVNQSGRTELNILKNFDLGEHLHSGLLLHGNIRPIRTDGNGDGFMDVPLAKQINIGNRWKFDNHQGVEAQVGGKILLDEKIGGQLDFNPDSDKGTVNAYGIGINTQRAEVWGKVGYVFENKRYKSIGLQLYVLDHVQQNFFGLRQYDAKQEGYYANLIYQSIIFNTNHKFKTGLSFQSDYYKEELNFLQNYNRVEQVSGAFFEYTYNHLDKFNLILGLRSDYNNLYGWIFTPRLHTRYEISEQTVLRASAGKGQRTANIFAENIALLASSRTFNIIPSFNKGAYQLEQEVSWNIGGGLSHCFRLNYKEGTVALDYYYTHFENQVVIDRDNDPQKVLIYNLDGRSYANSFQATVDYELVRRLDMRLAYRLYDVKTEYLEGILQKPLISKHRGFVNLAYETPSKWVFDYTLNVIGHKRLPQTDSNPTEYQLKDNSPIYSTMNAQISKSWKNDLRIYVGMENITNFRQLNPIIASDDPFGDYFDSSIVWGPIFGRMVYLGVNKTF